MDIQQLGPYRIISLLGEGGMGRAYRAVHQDLRREVALKLLHPKALESVEARARFGREMRLAATLSHPGVVKVYDGGVLDGVHYLAMELVDGPTVDQAVEGGGQVPWTFAAALGARIADSLAYLHEHGIIHRDVKHNNVKLTLEGEVKLLDFGLARSLDSTRLTGVDEWVGTFRYVAPEVLTGEPASPQSDLWSLGVMLYELGSGKPFLGHNSLQQFVQTLVNEDFVPLESVAPHLPVAFTRLVGKLLERDVSKRLASAAEAARELGDLLASVSVSGEVALVRRMAAPAPPIPVTVAPTIAIPVPPPVRPPVRVATRPGPEPRPGHRRWLALLPLGAGALIAGLLAPHLHEKKVTEAIAPLSAASTAPAAPPGTPALVGRWREVLQYAPRLAARGDPARRAILEVRAHSGLDLGEDPRVWLCWMQLGQWLETPAPEPPRLSDGAPGRMGVTDETLEITSVLLSDRLPSTTPSPTLGATALGLIARHPGDGRGWLLLGHEMEVEGLFAQAERVLRIGLARLVMDDIESCPEVLWCAVGRAAVRAPDPAAAWLKWFHHSSNPNKAWRGLRAAIEARDPALFEKILRVGVTDPKAAETAWHYLGKHYLHARRAPELAIAAWTEGAKSLPNSGDLLDLVVEFHLQRGDLPAVAPWLALPLGHERWQHVLARLRDDRAASGPCDTAAALATTEWRRRLVFAAGFLERGCLHEAEVLAKQVNADDEDDHEERLPVLLELFASGSQEDWLPKEFDRMLVQARPRWPLWSAAAGSLVTETGRPRMEKLLADAAEKWPWSWKVPLARALWLARHAKYGAALELLAKTRPNIVSDDPPLGAIAEILSRPVWASRLGSKVTKQVLDTALDDPGPSTGPAAKYWSLVRGGDLAQAGELARDEFLVDPEEPLWAQAVYVAASLPDSPPELKAWKQRIQFSVRSGTHAPWLVRVIHQVDRRVARR